MRGPTAGVLLHWVIISWRWEQNHKHKREWPMNTRPHVTRENAVSCQITFKFYRFFSQFVANSRKASLSCYIYCDLWQLMVILRIVYIIYCDFAIACDIYCHLWPFMAILQQFQIFLMILLFTAFSLVTWGLIVDKKKLFFPPCFKHPSLQDRQKRYLFSIFSDVEDHLEQTKSIKMSKITPPPPTLDWKVDFSI